MQADVVRWLEWLRADLGFDAFRFDNTKGYAANFTAAYVEAAAPLYSVGILKYALRAYADVC